MFKSSSSKLIYGVFLFRSLTRNKILIRKSALVFVSKFVEPPLLILQTFLCSSQSFINYVRNLA